MIIPENCRTCPSHGGRGSQLGKRTSAEGQDRLSQPPAYVRASAETREQTMTRSFDELMAQLQLAQQSNDASAETSFPGVAGY